MRKPYSAPEVAVLGSVTELTQADFLAPGADNLGSLIGGDWGGGGGSIYS